MKTKEIERATEHQECSDRRSLMGWHSCYIFLIPFIFFPNMIYGQDLDARIAEAVHLYEANEPSDASLLLQSILTSADAPQLEEAVHAKAYTYLAMSEWSLYRRTSTESAVISALELDASTFVTHGDSWATNNATIIDSVAKTVLMDAIFQYEEAEYTKSVEHLITIVPIEKYLPASLASDIHKYLAFNFVAQRKRKLAQQEFQTALRYNPKLTLGDDAVIAPKIRRTYMTIRDNTIQKSRHKAQLNTILRSLILPGWGQIHRGDRLRGYGFMAIQGGLLAGTLLSVRSYTQARDAYDPGFGEADALSIYYQRYDIDDVNAELNALYSRYQSKGRQTNVFIGLLATVWAVNIIDAMILSSRRDLIDFTTAPSRSGRLAMDWDQKTRLWRVQYRLNW